MTNSENISVVNKTSSIKSVFVNNKKDIIGEVIFVSNSQACHCILQKCNFIRSKLNEILIEKTEYANLIKLTEIDYYKEHQKVEEIFKQYELWFIPSVILKDKAGKIYYESSYDFDENLFRSKIAEMSKTYNSNYQEK
jgi:hypothetical protein